jgi:hypothetical protein
MSQTFVQKSKWLSLSWENPLVKIAVVAIILLIIYNYACDLPIIGGLCTVMHYLSKALYYIYILLSYVYKGISYVIGLF